MGFIVFLLAFPFFECISNAFYLVEKNGKDGDENEYFTLLPSE